MYLEIGLILGLHYLTQQPGYHRTLIEASVETRAIEWPRGKNQTVFTIWGADAFPDSFLHISCMHRETP